MKKISFFVIALFLANKTMLAQDVIYGGLKAAPNFSVFTSKAPENVKSGIGYSIGYFEVLELGNKINLQAEVNYNMMSFVKEIKNSSTGYSSTQKTVINNRSLELPVMVKYRPIPNFSIGVGYQFSLLPNGKEIYSEKETVGNTTTESKSKSETEGLKTSGFFLDMNTKISKNIVGLRVLSTNESFFESNESLNISAYIGFSIF